MSCQLLVLSIACTLLVCASTASVPAKSEDGKDRHYGAESGHHSFPVNQLPPLTYSTKKYTVYRDDVTFPEAWRLCIAKGKRLAAIESYTDHKAIRKAIQPYFSLDVAFWIAATNLGARSSEYDKFYWITNDRPIGYLNGFENWAYGGAPTDSDQCTAVYLGSAIWITGECSSNAYYVCEESQDV